MEEIFDSQPTDLELILQALEVIDAKLSELLAGKRQLEAFATELQGKGPLALMSAFKGLNVG